MDGPFQLYSTERGWPGLETDLRDVTLGVVNHPQDRAAVIGVKRVAVGKRGVRRVEDVIELLREERRRLRRVRRDPTRSMSG